MHEDAVAAPASVGVVDQWIGTDDRKCRQFRRLRCMDIMVPPGGNQAYLNWWKRYGLEQSRGLAGLQGVVGRCKFVFWGGGGS